MAQKSNFIKKIARWVLFILLCLVAFRVAYLISAVIPVSLHMKPDFASVVLGFFSCLALYQLIIRKNETKAFGALIIGIFVFFIFLSGFIGVIISLIVYYYYKKKSQEELIKATEKSDEEKVREILDKINIRDKYGMTAFDVCFPK